jgi:predicted transcriptional regulator
MTKAEQMLLLNFFKALADESRLKLLGFLGEGERNVSQLAELLQLSEPTISHHLAKLRAAGLVTLRTVGNQHFYSLNQRQLDKLKQLVGKVGTLAPVEEAQPDDAWIDALDLPEWDRKVLRDYTADGRLEQIPSRQKKLLVILRWLATRFQPDIMYSEREVNAILTQCHEDFATLRRELVDFGFLRRERGGGKYWLTPEDEAVLP